MTTSEARKNEDRETITASIAKDYPEPSPKRLVEFLALGIAKEAEKSSVIHETWVEDVSGERQPGWTEFQVNARCITGASSSVVESQRMGISELCREASLAMAGVTADEC